MGLCFKSYIRNQVKKYSYPVKKLVTKYKKLVTKLDNLVTKERSPVKSIPSNVVDTIWSCSLLKESFHTLRMISQDGKDQWVSTELNSPKNGDYVFLPN